MHFQKTTCFPQLLGCFLLPGKQRPCLKASKAMDPKEQNLSTLCALNDFIGSKLDFERSIKEHSESRGWPGTWEQELPWGHSVSVNVLPVTTALFADKSPAVSNQWQVQDSALHQDGSSAKQAKQLLGWNRAGNPLPLSSASGWKEGRRTVKRLGFQADPRCHLLLPPWKKGIVWAWGLDKRLDFPKQLLFIHRLVAGRSHLPYVSLYSLVRITMYTAFSFIASNDFINSSFCALLQSKLRPLGTDALLSFLCLYTTTWPMCVVHGWALMLDGNKTIHQAIGFYLNRIITKTDNIYWVILY